LPQASNRGVRNGRSDVPGFYQKLESCGKKKVQGLSTNPISREPFLSEEKRNFDRGNQAAVANSWRVEKRLSQQDFTILKTLTERRRSKLTRFSGQKRIKDKGCLSSKKNGGEELVEKQKHGGGKGKKSQHFTRSWTWGATRYRSAEKEKSEAGLGKNGEEKIPKATEATRTQTAEKAEKSQLVQKTDPTETSEH